MSNAKVSRGLRDFVARDPFDDAHPPPERLTAFGLGILSHADATAVEQHLIWCDSCVLLLNSIPKDPDRKSVV